MRVASKVGNLSSKFWHAMMLGLWVLELFAMLYATDGQTDGQKQRLLPPSLRLGAQQEAQLSQSGRVTLHVV